MPTIRERITVTEIAALERLKTALYKIISEMPQDANSHSADDIFWLIEWFKLNTSIDVPFVLAGNGCLYASSYLEAQELNIVGAGLNVRSNIEIISVLANVLDNRAEELQENLTWDGEGVSVVTTDDGQYGVCRWNDAGKPVLIFAL